MHRYPLVKLENNLNKYEFFHQTIDAVSEDYGKRLREDIETKEKKFMASMRENVSKNGLDIFE